MDTNLSISMLIENDLGKQSPSPKNILSYTPLPIKQFEERKIYQWVKDRSVTTCYNCQEQFTLINRKHHCRNCGKIYCGTCSNYYIELPHNVETVPMELNVFDYKNYIRLSSQERVCEHCYSKIVELKELSQSMEIFELLPLDVLDYRNISQVCRSWNKIAKYYLSRFREIQYYFPDHIFTKRDMEILYINRKYFCGHSKWLLQLISSTDWDSENSPRKEILELIKCKQKNTSCWSILCTRSCQNTLQLEDIIIILYKKITYVPLIRYLFNSLEEVPIEELSCYLSWLINSLYFYKDFTSIINDIEKFLINKAKTNLELCNQLFWTLTQQVYNPNGQVYFSQFRQKLVKCLDRSNYKLFQNGYDFTSNLIQVCQNSTPGSELMSIKNYLGELDLEHRKDFKLPINFNRTFLGFDINNIRVIDSKTKPIILPCRVRDSTYNIMLKKEDIRKEAIIMLLIRLIDIYIKKEEGLDLYITKYNILPISHEYGYIEFVRDSYTLYDIRENLGFSIQNFILERSPDITIKEFRERFTKSCAAYCVITYLLGIGDRHLDNIMVTRDGCLFHIDFGYILGRDPKYISPEIRLTSEMIDAMGGINSNNYVLFKDYCGRAYNCIRRHANIFYILLLGITQFQPELEDSSITADYIKNYIINRFIPGESYKDADLQFRYKIDTNSNTYGESLIDFFHKKNKRSSGLTPSENKEISEVIKEKAYIIGDFVKDKLYSGWSSLFQS